MNSKRLLTFSAICAVFFCAVVSCSKQPVDLTTPPQPVTKSGGPSITGFSPASGKVGSTVLINGSNFAGTVAGNTVKFNGVTSTVSAVTSSSITVVVPSDATTGRISITAAGETTTSAREFTVSQ